MLSPPSHLKSSHFTKNPNSKRLPPSKFIQTKQAQPKLKINNPELESAMFLAKANVSARTVVYSPVENKIKSLKRNIYLQTTDDPLNQDTPGNILTKNPYISNDIKNKYNEILTETLTNPPILIKSSPYAPVNTAPNPNTVLPKTSKTFGYGFNNENKYNKKKEIYLLLTNEEDANCRCRNEEEINQKFRELSNERNHFVKPVNKILLAKKQIGKIIDSVNNKNFYNNINIKEKKGMLLFQESLIKKFHNNVGLKNNKEKSDSHRIRLNYESLFPKSNNNLNRAGTVKKSRNINNNKEKISNLRGRVLTFM